MAEDQTMPPEGKLVYRLLTGKDDDAFCRRVSEALAMGYTLYGSPSISFNGEHPIVCQAVLWSGQRKAAIGETEG